MSKYFNEDDFASDRIDMYGDNWEDYQEHADGVTEEDLLAMGMVTGFIPPLF